MFFLGLILGLVGGAVIGTFVGPNILAVIHYLKNGAGR